MAPLTSALSTSASIEIHATPGRVWEALTSPPLIERWFFGVSTETDWVEGSSIVHRGEYQGQPYEDRGTIEHVEPARSLVHTHWSPASGLPDEPEHYQEVSWRLTERPRGTTLTVTETNLPSEAARAISERSWPQALQGLKAVAEERPEG